MLAQVLIQLAASIPTAMRFGTGAKYFKLVVRCFCGRVVRSSKSGGTEMLY